jgi:hypothetical protein
VAGAAATGSASAQTELAQAERTGPIGWIEAAAALIAGGFTVVGIIWLPRSRLRAYHAFELAILVLRRQRPCQQAHAPGANGNAEAVISGYR